MNQAFQSYTPRVLPMDYDSLEGETGCQSISGTSAGQFLAFIQFCAFEDSELPVFDQPDTVSYTHGPDEPGNEITTDTFLTEWAAWVASAGVRIGQFSFIEPPSDSDGVPSALYPSTTPAKVAIAFDGNGLLSMAIQADENTIEWKWYTSELGGTVTHSFQGYSAILVSLAPLIPGSTDMAILYLIEDKPRQIFARIRSAPSTEVIMHNRLPSALTRLIQAEKEGQTVVLYAQDERGFDVYLTSPAYPLQAAESSELDLTISDGIYFEAAVAVDPLAEEATLDFTIESGSYADVLIEPSPQPAGEEAELALAIVSGSYYTES